MLTERPVTKDKLAVAKNKIVDAINALDDDNPTKHTSGTVICGECELLWVDKIGAAKLVGIE